MRYFSATLKSPLNTHTHTWTYLSECVSSSTDNFQGHLGMCTHCECTCCHIFQSSLSLRDFHSLISDHVCSHVFKTAPQYLEANPHPRARCGAEVSVLTGAGEVLEHCMGMNSTCWRAVIHCITPILKVSLQIQFCSIQKEHWWVV